MYIDEPHLDLVGKIEFEPNLIVAKLELKPEPCNLDGTYQTID